MITSVTNKLDGQTKVTSAVIIWFNNILADVNAESFHKWSLSSDFTPWSFVSALLWVPGGTAGIYAIRRAGLAISVGIWSSVIVLGEQVLCISCAHSFCNALLISLSCLHLGSFIWGVFIFGEKQKSFIGAISSVTVLCLGLVGIAYFSSIEMNTTEKDGETIRNNKNDNTTATINTAREDTPLVEKGERYSNEIILDLEHFPHSGVNPHSHQTIDLPHLHSTSKYHIGLFMAVVNGVLAATIMVPLHYAPPNTTEGVGYSMSFGIAAVLVVGLFWILRLCYLSFKSTSIQKGYKLLPSFHIRVMWRAGLTSGLLYSVGNMFGIVSINHLGNFMGYSLNQSSIIISGLWGLLYYKEIPGTMNMIGFFFSLLVVFVGILLMGREHI